MLDFFSTIVTYLETFFRFIGMTISNLASAIGYLVSSQSSITLIVGYMPAIIGGACLAFISLGVIRFLLLR